MYYQILYERDGGLNIDHECMRCNEDEDDENSNKTSKYTDKCERSYTFLDSPVDRHAPNPQSKYHASTCEIMTL